MKKKKRRIKKFNAIIKVSFVYFLLAYFYYTYHRYYNIYVSNEFKSRSLVFKQLKKVRLFENPLVRNLECIKI